MIDTIKNLLESFYIVLKYINKTVNIFTQKINVSLINILKIRKIYRATSHIQPQHPSRDNRPCELWIFPLKSVLNSVPTLKILHNATLAAARFMDQWAWIRIATDNMTMLEAISFTAFSAQTLVKSAACRLESWLQ